MAAGSEPALRARSLAEDGYAEAVPRQQLVHVGRCEKLRVEQGGDCPAVLGGWNVEGGAIACGGSRYRYKLLNSPYGGFKAHAKACRLEGRKSSSQFNRGVLLAQDFAKHRSAVCLCALYQALGSNDAAPHMQEKDDNHSI